MSCDHPNCAYNHEPVLQVIEIVDTNGIMIFRCDLIIHSLKNLPVLSETLKTMIILNLEDLTDEIKSNKKFMNQTN